MRKNLFISTLVMMAILASSAISYAQESTTVNQFEKRRPPHEFKKGHSEFKKQEHQQRKSEFEKRLNLTDEQKKQIEENRQKDHEIMRPIIKEIREKRHQFFEIENNTTLSADEKEVQKSKLKSEIKVLKAKADELRKQNMKKFESLLTKEQQKEFNQIKKEQKAKRKKMLKEIKKNEYPIMPPPQGK